MTELNNANSVQQQYKTAGNLSIRMSIHGKYSINKMGFGNWIASKYALSEGMRILELGCGTGDFWKSHPELSDTASEIILTDFSPGMVETAREKLRENKRISFEIVDIQNIPYEDGRFDMVIANMMLYHVPDIHKGLREVRRVLKDGSAFYCATYGENGIAAYIAKLLSDYGVEDLSSKSFTLQNGAEILGRHFQSVDRYDYEDALAVTEPDDMIDYLYSLSGMSNIGNIERPVLRRILTDHMENGILYVPKEYGMFVCRQAAKKG